jgi:hypothetical protein
MRIFGLSAGNTAVSGRGVGGSRQAQEASAPMRTQRKRAMNMYMRTLILGAAIGIAAAVTTISPTQAGVIGPGKLHITEPESLAFPVFFGKLVTRANKSVRKFSRGSGLSRQRSSVR